MASCRNSLPTLMAETIVLAMLCPVRYPDRALRG